MHPCMPYAAQHSTSEFWLDYHLPTYVGRCVGGSIHHLPNLTLGLRHPRRWSADVCRGEGIHMRTYVVG